MNKAYVAGVVVVLVALTLYAYRGEIRSRFFEPTKSVLENRQTQEGAREPEIVADKLNIPWEIVFLPGGDLLVSERPGRLLRIGEGRNAIEVSGVTHRGEGGLLGLALHPDFVKNGWVYLYLTTASGSGLTNRVERYVLHGTTLSERTVIIENI